MPAAMKDAVAALLSGRAVVFAHSVAGGERAQLVALAATADEAALRLLLGHGAQLQLFAAREALRGTELYGFVPGAGVGLPCELSPAGLSRLAGQLKNRNTRDFAGADSVALRLFPDEIGPGHNSAEADLAELLSFMDRASEALWVSPLFGRDGAPMPAAAAQKWATAEQLLCLDTGSLRRARAQHPRLLDPTGELEVSLAPGRFRLLSFFSRIDRCYHWAFVKGEPASGGPALVRLESECLTGHVFGSLLCDCGQQLERGLRLIEAEGRGVLVYLRQEGRGIGLVEKIRAYRLQQEESLDTVDANLALGLPEDARDYAVGAQILSHLGLQRVRLLTNNPAKVRGLEAYGIEVAERVPHVVEPTPENERYLGAKKARLGHLI